MRKILVTTGLWLGLAGLTLAAEISTLPLTDGSSLQGEIIKFDDKGLQLRTAAETYTNLEWTRFSQDALKQLGTNPKIKPLVDPFIEPETSQRPPKAEIQINEVRRLALPANPSILGGLFHSSVGLFILFVLYLANLVAGYEVSIFKARAAAQVVGVSALLPIIGPIIFLLLPMPAPAPVEENPEMIAPAGTQAAAHAAAGAAGENPSIEIAEASWKQAEEKKIEAQVYARGKFTFNKRFLETKFAGFIGAVPAGEATKFSMEVKSGAGQFAVEHIAQVGAAEVILETVNGQVTVPFADIQEIKLNPRTA